MPHNARRHSIGMLALFLLCAVFTPARAQAQTDEQLIRAIDSTFNVAFAARDTVKIASFYATEAVGMYPNTPIARGARAIGHTYAEFSGMPGVKLVGTPVSVVISRGGDLATVTGTYRSSFNSASGPVADSGSYLDVFRKVNGQWRIVNEIVTSQAPMATMAVYDTVGTMAMAGGSTIQWGDLKVPGFPAGAKIAAIHGDPASTGDYVVRLQFPDGYRFPVHWHPKAEHLTVLSGTFLLGMGGTVNTATEKSYQPGDFLYLPARKPHSGGAKGVTVVQLHGTGPFAINLGTP